MVTIVKAFMGLDVVKQAPGESVEDTLQGFKYGSWTASYTEQERGEFMEKIAMSGQSVFIVNSRSCCLNH